MQVFVTPRLLFELFSNKHQFYLHPFQRDTPTLFLATDSQIAFFTLCLFPSGVSLRTPRLNKSYPEKKYFINVFSTDSA